jgi:hypothetical protein
MAKKFEAPNLANATPQFLVDEMGKLSIAENYAKKMRKFYKEALFARVGIDASAEVAPQQHTGERYIASVQQSNTRRLNQQLLQEKYPEIFEECKTDSRVTTTRFSGVPGTQQDEAIKVLEAIYAELGLDDNDGDDA